MAHRGKQKGDLLLVMTHIGRLLHDFDHEDAIVGAVASVQASQALGQLVAKDQD